MEDCQGARELDTFFMTDKIQKGEDKVAYCPIENLFADFSTTTGFVIPQNARHNLPSNKNLWRAQECVGRRRKKTRLNTTENSLDIKSSDE